MFTTALMRLHQAGKVSNRCKACFAGFSVTTFALGSRALYDWLNDRSDVRFLPVDVVNDPTRIGRNQRMISLNGALEIDLQGQVVADTLHGVQYSGIGGHEDFVSGAGLGEDDRSLLCLPSTANVSGRRVSRIVRTLAPGSIVTTPRHQVDVIVTEFGAAELAGVSVEERAERLVAIAHPDFRDELKKDRESLSAMKGRCMRRRILVGLLVGLVWAAPGRGAEPAYDPVLAELGAEAFPRYCASCHGVKALGDGPRPPR